MPGLRLASRLQQCAHSAQMALAPVARWAPVAARAAAIAHARQLGGERPRPAWSTALRAVHGPGRLVAPPGFNRWLVPPTAISFHLCLGGVYGWSLFNAPLTKVLGVVSSSALDWGMGSVVPIFSTAIFFLGITSAVAGRHLDLWGPRLFGLASAALWSAGFGLSSLGVALHCLPLVYLGYGVLGGIGLGLGYLAPVKLLMSWFPERRGMATGLGLMGFGGGAVVSTPVADYLLSRFRVAPTWMGPLDMPGQHTIDGVRYLEVGGENVEVVGGFAADVAGFSGLEEGLYLVGSGSMGLVETFACFGAGYFAVMSTSALCWRVPDHSWVPANVGMPVPLPKAQVGLTTEAAMKTPQFALLWVILCCSVTGGMGMMGVAKDMMVDIFSVLPVVTPGFAGGYVMSLSLANMSGRFVWSTVSDHIGRKNAYATYFTLGAPLFMSLPLWAAMVSSEPGVLPLACFYVSTLITFSTCGAGFSTLPAYVADTFGPRHVSGIFGRLLTAWSVAGVLGPVGFTTLGARAQNAAIADLAASVDDAQFLAAFQAPKEELAALAASKAVTVAKLLELAPPGTLNPTPAMYNEMMFAIAGMQCAALVLNAMMRPHPHAGAVSARSHPNDPATVYPVGCDVQSHPTSCMPYRPLCTARAALPVSGARAVR